MTFNELQQAADAAMNDTLTSAGFRRTAPGTWNRRSGDELSVVQLQKQSAAESFCVNLGVHYAFLPKAGSQALLEGDQIELPDCEVKLRLTERPSDKDQWWPISETSVGQVANLMTSRGLSTFDAYRVDGGLSAVDAKSIESGNPGLFLASVSKGRACLLLALRHEQLGTKEKCIEAATIGLKLVGSMAVGTKKALKDILKRCGQPA